MVIAYLRTKHLAFSAFCNSRQYRIDIGVIIRFLPYFRHVPVAVVAVRALCALPVFSSFIAYARFRIVIRVARVYRILCPRIYSSRPVFDDGALYHSLGIIGIVVVFAYRLALVLRASFPPRIASNRPVAVKLFSIPVVHPVFIRIALRYLVRSVCDVRFFSGSAPVAHRYAFQYVLKLRHVHRTVLLSVHYAARPAVREVYPFQKSRLSAQVPLIPYLPVGQAQHIVGKSVSVQIRQPHFRSVRRR